MWKTDGLYPEFLQLGYLMSLLKSHHLEWHMENQLSFVCFAQNFFLPPSFLPSKGLSRVCIPYLGIAGAIPEDWFAASPMRSKQKILCKLMKTDKCFCFILSRKTFIMAESSPYFNSILNRVREKLRSENVKLWLAPYTTSSDEPGKYPEVLFAFHPTENSTDIYTLIPKIWLLNIGIYVKKLLKEIGISPLP